MSDVYENPLITRYASSEMATLWGSQRRVTIWRELWIALAESQQELGLAVAGAGVVVGHVYGAIDDVGVGRFRLPALGGVDEDRVGGWLVLQVVEGAVGEGFFV